MKQYLIRLDDACPTMNHAKWRQIEDILLRYDIKPMVGIVPHNEDPQLVIDSEEKDFWNENGSLARWNNYGWKIALHGYNHMFGSNKGLDGMNPLWSRSEFAGLSLDEQKNKIKEGVSIMRSAGFNPTFFFAPAHTFDDNTLKALFQESDIRIVSDTIALKPYRYGDFIIIPQICGRFRVMPLGGTYTFCLHPNYMLEQDFLYAEFFIRKYRQHFVSFDDLDLNNINKKSVVSNIVSIMYFTYRKLRGVY